MRITNVVVGRCRPCEDGALPATATAAAAPSLSGCLLGFKKFHKSAVLIL